MPAHNRAMPARQGGDACNHTFDRPVMCRHQPPEQKAVMPAHNTAMPARENWMPATTRSMALLCAGMMPAHNRAMPAREERDACNHTSVPAPIEGRCLQIKMVVPAHSRAMPAREGGMPGQPPLWGDTLTHVECSCTHRQACAAAAN